MNTIRSISGSSEVFSKVDNLANQLNKSFSEVVIMALSRLDEIEFNFLEAKPIEEVQSENEIKKYTSHIPVKTGIMESLKEQESGIKKTEKVELCEGGSHVRDNPIEVDGDIIAVGCKNCNHIMIVNHAKFEEWKKSQSEVIVQ